jgi:hypothetical protein
MVKFDHLTLEQDNRDFDPVLGRRARAPRAASSTGRAGRYAFRQ